MGSWFSSGSSTVLEYDSDHYESHFYDSSIENQWEEEQQPVKDEIPKPLKAWFDCSVLTWRIEKISSFIIPDSDDFDEEMISDYVQLLFDPCLEYLETVYPTYEKADEALKKLAETLHQVDRYVELVLPLNLYDLNKEPNQTTIRNLERVKNGIVTETFEKCLIAEKLDEELLVFGLPIFMLKHHVCKLFFCKDSETTLACAMTTDPELFNSDVSQALHRWQRRKLEISLGKQVLAAFERESRRESKNLSNSAEPCVPVSQNEPMKKQKRKRRQKQGTSQP